jgi:hypothetical protein
VEEESDSVEGRSSRQTIEHAVSFSPYANAVYFNPNSNLKIVHRMTAAALGSGRKGKKLTIETVGESNCGEPMCLKLQGGDIEALKLVQKHEIEVFSPKKANKAISEAIGRSYTGKERAIAQAVQSTFHVSGLTSLFDAVYRSGFARNKILF